MLNIYQRQAATFRNEMRTSCAALVGIAQGLLADGVLNDQEIAFLRDWLANSENISLTWPGSVIFAQVTSILDDGVVTEDERSHLTETLRQLVGGRLDELAEAVHVAELPLDNVQGIDIPGRSFCLTGEFVLGPRKTCEGMIVRRGGVIAAVTKKLDYLIVGGLGSPEWKHGSFGTKVEKAIQHKQAGVPLRIIHEDVWASSLRGYSGLAADSSGS
jgi:NAD-dependent DNA ligase